MVNKKIQIKILKEVNNQELTSQLKSKIVFKNISRIGKKKKRKRVKKFFIKNIKLNTQAPKINKDSDQTDKNQKNTKKDFDH